MKAKFDTLFRGVMLVLLITLIGGLWAGAQVTNKTPPAPTNQPSAVVKSIERLESHYLTFGLDRIGLLREYTFLGEPLWKYAASFIYILLAFYISKLIDYVTRAWLARFASRKESRLSELLLQLLEGPVKLVVFVVFLNIGLNIFDWPIKLQLYLSRGLVLVVAGAVTYLAIKVVNVLLDSWRIRRSHGSDRQFDEQLFSVLRKSLNTFVIIVAALVAAQNIGINITAVITSLSIGGLAVGLAAQDTLANLFGAIAVFADKPFRLGDQIKLDAAEGIVEDVGLRSTRVRHPEGHLIAVPNKTIGNAAISNLTNRAYIKTSMNLALPHTLPSAKLKRALAIMDDVYRGNAMTEKVWISFNQFSGATLNIQIVHWWKGTDYQKYLAGMQEMNLAVKDRLDAEGIALA